MRIDSTSGFPTVGLTPTSAASVHSGAKSGNKVETPVGNEDSTFTPTPDLARLLSAVKSLPDVRPDAVAAASKQLASGDLLTPNAASDTAQAIQASNVPLS